MSQETFILKILSGPQLGTEVELVAGSYSFGSGDDVDLNFSDNLVDAEHGELRLAPGRIEIRSSGGQLSTASGLAIAADDEGWHEIAQLDIVMAGSTRFALGGAKAQWSKLRDDVQQPASTAAHSRWSMRDLRIPAVVALVFAIYLGTAQLPFESAGQGNRSGQLPPGNEIVAVALEGLRFDHSLTATTEADGRVVVSGYVNDVVERRAVRQALADVGVPVSTRVWAVDVLQNDVDALLVSQNLDLNAEVGSQGTLKLTGRIMDQAVADETVALLQSEVLGLAGVDPQVRTPADVLDDAKELLAWLRLSKVIILRVTEGLIEATGVVPVDKVDNWAGFIGAYSNSLIDDMPLRSFVSIEGKAPPPPVVILPENQKLSQDAPALEPGQRAISAARAAAEPTIIADPDTAGVPSDAPQVASQLPERAEAEHFSEALPWLRIMLRDDPERLISALGLPANADTLLLIEDLLRQAEANPGSIAQTLAALPQDQRTRLMTFVQDAAPANSQTSTLVTPGQRDAFDVSTTFSPAEPGGTTATSHGADVSWAMNRVLSFAMGNTDVNFDAVFQDGNEAQSSADTLDRPTAEEPIAPLNNLINPQAATHVASTGQATNSYFGDAPEPPSPLEQSAFSQAPQTSGSLAFDARGDQNLLSMGTIIDVVQTAIATALSTTESVRKDADDAPVQLASASPNLSVQTVEADDALSVATTALLPAEATHASLVPLSNEFMRLIQATDLTILGDTNAETMPTAEEDQQNNDGVASAGEPTQSNVTLPNIAGLSPVLIDVVDRQHMALSRGRSILPASREAAVKDGTCGPDSRIHTEQLPTLLFWMDYFSTNPNVDMAEFEGPNSLLFYELAMSPGVVRNCLKALDNPMARALLENSVYLRETEVNERFTEFLLRNVPRFQLDMAGLSLGSESYVELRDGRKLTKGMAPSLGSRIAAIGELGLLIRLASGFEVSLYGDDLMWRMEDG